MLPDRSYSASWRTDDNTLLKAIVKDTIARRILACQKHGKIAELVPVERHEFHIYSVGEPPPFKPYEHKCTAMCPRSSEEVVFEIHSRPDKDGKQVFTIHWYDGGPFKDIYVNPPRTHRAQVFNSRLEYYTKKHSDRGQSVRVEERIRTY
jgi:hypothetical protein